MKNNNSKITAPQEFTNLFAEEVHASFVKNKERAEAEARRKYSELKPCPFCGEIAKNGCSAMDYPTWNVLTSAWCDNCGAKVENYANINNCKQVLKKTIEEWNTRPPLTPDQVSQWLQDNGYEDMSKGIDCDFEL